MKLKDIDIELARKVFSCIDHTTLGGGDNERTVEAFCRRARELKLRDGRGVAAVCVYPRFVGSAVRVLEGSGIGVASVAGAFPHGQLPIGLKVEEVKQAVGDGVDEVDIVINRGLMLEGRSDEVREEVAAMKAVCGGSRLKVILETCELPTEGLIREATRVAIEGGADFVKTSTGKGGGGATLEAAAAMLEEIASYVKICKKPIGFKAAGGIREPEEALGYAKMASKVMGEEYINSQTFRIGTSRLTERLHSLLTF